MLVRNTKTELSESMLFYQQPFYDKQINQLRRKKLLKRMFIYFSEKVWKLVERIYIQFYIAIR